MSGNMSNELFQGLLGQAGERQGGDKLTAIGTCFAQDAVVANSPVLVG